MNPNAMNRRTFLITAGGASLAGAAIPALVAGAEAPKADPNFWTPTLLSSTGFETLVLTWAGDPGRTMRLQWLQATEKAGVAPAPVTLIFRGKGQAGALTATSRCHGFGAPSTRIWVHRIDLANLTPDTRYAFDMAGEKLAFQTAPEKLTKDLVFAEGGDIGTTEPVVSALHRMVAEWDPLFAHVGGDLSYSNGVTLDLEIKFLVQWRKYMVAPGNRLIPMVPGIGNHEVIGGYGKTPKEAPYFYALFGGHLAPDGAYGNFRMGDFLSLILLDSGHTSDVEKQTPYLVEQLKASARIPNVFISYHIGAWPSVRDDKGKLPTLIRTSWLPAIEASKVKVVFEHHDHAFKKTLPLKAGAPAPDGIVYLGDGDWGRETRKVKTKEERPWLDKVSSDFNVWKVTLTKKGQVFEAFNEKKVLLDRFEKTT